MWPVEGTVTSAAIRALVAACNRLGLDGDLLLRSAGIARETLEDPDALLPNRDVVALWAKAYQLSGDPVLSLHAAECCPLGAYKVIDYIGTNAHDVGEAFRYVARYFKLLNRAVTLSVDESADPVTFDLAGATGGAALSRPYAEYLLAVFLLHMQAGAGVPLALREVTFAYPRPPDIGEHERIFRCPVRFETPHNRLYIERTAWQTPMIAPHEGVFRVLVEHADLLMSRLPRGPDLVERTRRAIGGRLRGGEPSLAGVARELGLSERSLQRHLRELGYTYKALDDEVRLATARLYLQQSDMSLAEVGYLLGFADQSAFNRAFKQWAGSTPKQARAQLMQPRPPSAPA